MALEFGIDLAQVLSGFTNIVNYILLMIAVGFAGFIAWFFVYYKSFNKIVVVRKMINGKSIIMVDKAKRWKDRDGIIYLKLWHETDKHIKNIPIPPGECIDITSKGKEWIEVKLSASGSYIFLKDEDDIKEIPDNLFDNPPQDIVTIEDNKMKDMMMESWKDKVLEEWKKKNNLKYAFKPFGTEDRVLLVNNIRNAEKRRGKSIWENLPQIAALGTMAIVVICLMIFWADIAKPVLDARKIGIEENKIEKETLQIIQNIEFNTQSIKAEQDNIKERLDGLESGD